MIWLTIILSVLWILFNVIWDYRIWLKQLNKPENKRDHKKGWWLKAATSIPSLVLFAWLSNFKWVLALSVSAGMLMAWFWFGFDLCSNLWRGYPAFFTGSEDGKDDAGTDNFLQSIPTWLHISIKLILVIGSTWLYYISTTK
jgi:hypothetical protein